MLPGYKSYQLIGEDLVFMVIDNNFGASLIREEKGGLEQLAILRIAV